MIEFKVKYKIWDYVTLVWHEEKHRVLWYEYLEGRWMRYIVQDKSEFKYLYEYQIQMFIEESIVWFKSE